MAITADEARALAARGEGRAAAGPRFDAAMERLWARIRAVAEAGRTSVMIPADSDAYAVEMVSRLTAAGFGAAVVGSGGTVSVSWGPGQVVGGGETR